MHRMSHGSCVPQLLYNALFEIGRQTSERRKSCEVWCCQIARFHVQLNESSKNHELRTFQRPISHCTSKSFKFRREIGRGGVRSHKNCKNKGIERFAGHTIVGSVVWLLWRAVSSGRRNLHLPRAQLQVSFCQRATNYRALFREMMCKEKASYASSPLCT